MAVDEFLLERAIAPGELSIRIYCWESPTVSLGYFQDSEAFLAGGNFDGLAAVRRLSGGGAILHDREITYSIAVPAGHPLTVDPVRLYEEAHAAIQTVLQLQGVEVSPRGEAVSLTEEPFLCFSRGDRNDLVLSGVKVAGSAQRRRKGAVLQHGSILLEASPHAPELPGIANLVTDFRPDSSLPGAIGKAISGKIVEPFETTPYDVVTVLSEHELARVREIEAQRYASLDSLPSGSPGKLNP